MKRLLSVSLILVLVLSLFTGCKMMTIMKEIADGKELTFDDLSLTVPSQYVDLTHTVFVHSLVFVYGNGDSGVMGMKEAVSDLNKDLFLKPDEKPEINTPKEYAELFLKANNLDCEITRRDDIVTFTYTASNDGHEFTYLCGVFANTENFWVVQTYCYSENFTKNEAEFWNILKSVKV